MKIITEKSIDQFKPWSGAVDTFNRIKEAELLSELESWLEELYPDGMTDTELNDLLWFDDETVYKWLCMTDEA